MRQLLLGMGLAGQQLNLHVLYQFVYWNNTTTTQLIHSCKTAQKKLLYACQLTLPGKQLNVGLQSSHHLIIPLI
jgi:hypothetical protein